MLVLVLSRMELFGNGCSKLILEALDAICYSPNLISTSILLFRLAIFPIVVGSVLIVVSIVIYDSVESRIVYCPLNSVLL
jgi:hypothetical protein